MTYDRGDISNDDYYVRASAYEDGVFIECGTTMINSGDSHGIAILTRSEAQQFVDQINKALSKEGEIA